ncbi:MAG: hypothetical protein AMXMBFR84_04610 [Candidatus Hydrogenedentota bacterium]
MNRFSNRVDSYRKYRPDYPAAVLDWLSAEAGLTTASIVADVGSGTGISAKLFLDCGCAVYGVEPNDPMRLAAEDFLKEYQKFRSVNGTAEATSLGDNSVDFIVAAQAFHWFDVEKTAVEFRRILKPDGVLVLMWNQRDLDSTPFLQEYEAFLRKYGTDYEKVAATYLLSPEKKAAMFTGGVHEASFPHGQSMDFEGLKGRVLSSSYMPSETDPSYGDMLVELQQLFDKHAENGQVRHVYNTVVYWGRIA